ncbi:TPA: low temperature requirement protein A [Bacillus cereus]|nr:low temperature requirement protein A [Bacillus cereus]
MEEKKVTWLELFFDLIFVAAISKATHLLLHLEHGIIPFEYLLKFVLIFIPIWWAWVGQSLYVNRFGKDCVAQRWFMIIQMLFIILMTASLSVNFDQYYVPFLIGYVGIRFFTSIQYIWISKQENGSRKKVAKYLGYGFLMGIAVSLCSIFLVSWVRYLILYMGIFIDIFVPILGRRYLIKAPANTPHLLERFGLFTIILFGESILSLIAVLHPEKGSWDAISFVLVSFAIIIIMWWQYFDNVEKRVDKEAETTGQAIIYGHLFIYMSLSMIASSIQLAFLQDIQYLFLVIFVFISTFIYFLSTTFIFHKYRFVKKRLKIYHLGLFICILLIFLIFDLFIVVPNIIIFAQLVVFFLIYTRMTVV